MIVAEISDAQRYLSLLVELYGCFYVLRVIDCENLDVVAVVPNPQCSICG